jgi:ADP-ribosylglycohydrolase
MNDHSTMDRAVGCLLGLAIGDALGTTLEFTSRDARPPLTDMIGGGPFGLKPGEWTDDTSMALCLAESLLACGKLKEVGHNGDAQDHPVCRTFLRELMPAKKGSDLLTSFAGPPYGWPRDAIEAAMLVLANAGQVKVTGADGKPAVAVDLNATQLRTCTFTPENRVVSAMERLAVQSLGRDVGVTVPPAKRTITS